MDARKSATFGAFVVLLFSQAHYVFSQSGDCGLKLDVVDVKAAESPIVLKYPDNGNGAWPPVRKSGNSVEIFHPAYLETNCLVRNLWIGGGLVSLSCLNHNLQFPGLENWPDNVRATSLIGGHQGITFDNYTIVTPEHPSPISFDKMSGPVKCTGAVEPTMKKLSDTKYQVGYQMNALDFVPIFGMAFMDQLTFAHVKLLSTINRRPRIDENKENLRKGPIYKNLPVPTSQLSTKSHLSLILKDILKKKYPTDALEDDYLVHGQLLSKDDLFYIPEQRATFFFENTALIWNSINEGNWKMVGDIVRKLAYETFKDVDVYSGTAECLSLDEIPENFTEPVCVPKFLFKIALDKRYDSTRGIVFITVNDPSVKVNGRGSIPSEYKFCEKKPVCDQLYPEFSSTKKGYTYCCDLNHFIPWNDIRNSGVEIETPGPEIRPPPFYAAAAFSGGAKGPPPPPPPLPPMVRPATAPHPTPMSAV